MCVCECVVSELSLVWPLRHTWGQYVCLVSIHLALAGIGLRFWVDLPLAEPRHCLKLI